VRTDSGYHLVLCAICSQLQHMLDLDQLATRPISSRPCRPFLRSLGLDSMPQRPSEAHLLELHDDTNIIHKIIIMIVIVSSSSSSSSSSSYIIVIMMIIYLARVHLRMLWSDSTPRYNPSRVKEFRPRVEVCRAIAYLHRGPVNAAGIEHDSEAHQFSGTLAQVTI